MAEDAPTREERDVILRWRPRRPLGLALIVIAAAVPTIGWADATTMSAATFSPPPIGHVFVINLENTSYRNSFGTPANDPYLATTLRSRGVLLRQYFGTGHESLDNYVAQVSGQGPTPETQADCPTFLDFRGAAGGPDGQAVGQGCVYPAGVQTIGDQLEAAGLTWKGYMEDMGNDPAGDGGKRCAHPPIDGQDQSGDRPGDAYATKHDPFVYFHSVIDDRASCNAHVVPLTQLTTDLNLVRTTPNLSYITPNLLNDGHDTDVAYASEWLHGFLPRILKSRAYRADGMVIVTFDEAETSTSDSPSPDDVAACCNEIPGPNTPMPGIAGPGGGRVGALILSRYVTAGSTSDVPYNHYSLLRSIEDAFGITAGGDDGHGHLGYAGTYATYPGPGSFGPDVYSRP
jgi:hypothetical protein